MLTATLKTFALVAIFHGNAFVVDQGLTRDECIVAMDSQLAWDIIEEQVGDDLDEVYMRCEEE